MAIDYLTKFDSFKDSPRYHAAVREEILRQAGGVGGRALTEEEKTVLLQHAQMVKNKAVQEHYPLQDQIEADDRFQIALDLTSGDAEREKRARERITADKQSQGHLPSLGEQGAIVEAIKDNSPLKPIENLVSWLKEVWGIIKPILEAIKEMYDIMLPFIKEILKDLPEALNVIRKDLIVPYLEACKDWKSHLEKVAQDLRSGVNAAALDINGMPKITPPNFDMAKASKLKAALSIGFVRDLAMGVIAPLAMEQYQANVKRGFYSPVQFYKWLVGNAVGPDIAGIANDLFRFGRRVSQPVGGIIGAVADEAEQRLGEVPDWFIAQVDPDTGKMDYYLRR